MLEVDNAPLHPKVIEYSDYHRYLRDFYNFKKAQSRHFSFRKFSSLAGIKSSNFLMLVMDGKRKLSAQTAKAVAKAMRLSKSEADYFVSLVKLEGLSSGDDREQIERERKIALKKVISRDLPADKAEYLSVWYYSLVRELAFLPDFEPKAAWISKKLGGCITEVEAERAIKVLVNTGLWRGSKGEITVTDTFIDTGVEELTYGEINVAMIHKQNLLAWSKLIDTLPKANRELGLLNIPINSSKIPEFKKRIQSFQDEMIGWLQDEKAPDQIVQLGTYLIPMTKSSHGR